MFRRLAIGGGALTLLAWGYMKLPNSIFYRDRRPTALGRRVNGTQAWLYGLGMLPSFLVELEWRGRKTGRAFRAPVVVADYEGSRYLVSMLGDRSGWVRNIRAAGGQAWIKHGKKQEVRLTDVPVEERPPILRAYLQRAPGARPHFTVLKDAPFEEFAAVAAAYPVFRIEPVAGD